MSQMLCSFFWVASIDPSLVEYPLLIPDVAGCGLNTVLYWSVFGFVSCSKYSVRLMVGLQCGEDPACCPPGSLSCGFELSSFVF